MVVKLPSHQFLLEGSHELWGAMGGSDFRLGGSRGVDDQGSEVRVGDREFVAWERGSR